MTRIDHVFVDLDGVLANFKAATVLAHKRVSRGCTDNSTPQWDYWKAWGLTDEEFWSGIDYPEFYDGVRPLPGFETLLSWMDFVAEQGVTVSILTECYEYLPSHFYGKAKWIEEHMGTPSDRFGVIVTSRDEKLLLAGPKRMLIDDRGHNIFRWRLAGGFGVQYPQEVGMMLRWSDEL